MKEKTGLWKRKSKKGNDYYSGKLRIAAEEYSIALFKNDKDKDSQPDLMLYINKIEDIKKEKTSYTVDEIVNSEEFAKGTEDISDEDLAF